jgi:hypothetical protein
MTQISVVKVLNKAGLGFKKENPNQADYRTNFLLRQGKMRASEQLIPAIRKEQIYRAFFVRPFVFLDPM